MSEPLLATVPAPAGGVVNHDNPWPGLEAFREDDHAFFRGRGRETEQLLDLVLRERVTVLYGASGLGKTSLLHAGVFPKLRPQDILPVSVRLDFLEGAPPLRHQVFAALLREAHAYDIEAPGPRQGETLWETFHREDADLWSPRNRIVIPLLVFDQFEEVFTLGRQRRPEETAAFLDELATLAEGRPPAVVKEKLEQNPASARVFSFDRHPYKILFCLRSDYLAHFETLRDRMRSIIYNRMPLRPMDGDHALQVVRAGRHLLEEEVDERIVLFVAGREEESEPKLDFGILEIDPALLSLLCEQLNLRRREKDLSRINRELVTGNREAIITKFYEDSVAGLGPEVRSFVEEKLLTSSGHRNYVAEDDALATPGVTQEILDKLIKRRLLRIEPRGSVPRIELTHDVLIRTIRSSRDARRERERAEVARRKAREAEEQLLRSQRTVAALILLLFALLIMAGWGVHAEKKARKALASSQLEKALVATDQRARLAWLAAAVQSDPTNSLARNALAFQLIQHTRTGPIVFEGSRPVLIPSRNQILTRHATSLRLYDIRTGKRLRELKGAIPSELETSEVVVAKSGDSVGLSTPTRIRVWDLDNLETDRAANVAFPPHEIFELSPDFRWIGFRDGSRLILRKIEDESAQPSTVLFPSLRELERDRPLITPPLLGLIRAVRFASYGDQVAIASDRQAILWNAWTGTLQSKTTSPEAWREIDLSPGGDLLAAASENGDVRVLDLRSGSVLAGPLPHPEPVQMLRLDSRRFLLTVSGQLVRFWDLTANTILGEAFPLRGQVRDACFNHDGSRVILTTTEGVELLDVASGRAFSPSLKVAGIQEADFSPDSHTLRIATLNAVYLWDVPLLTRSEATILAQFVEASTGWTANDQGRLVELENSVDPQAVLSRETDKLPSDVKTTTFVDLTEWLKAPKLATPLSKAPTSDAD
jgi:WD40 repeat protein